MSRPNPSSPHSTTPLVQRLQSWQRRLVILLIGLFSSAVLVASLGALWSAWEQWAWFGGGLFLGGAGAVGIMLYHIRSSLSNLPPELPAALPDPKLDPRRLNSPEVGYQSPTQNQDRPARSLPETREAGWSKADLEELAVQFRQLLPGDFKGMALHKKVTILAANEALALMFGYDLAEIKDKTLLDLVTPESRSIVLRNSLVQYGKPYEVIGLKKSGISFPIQLYSTTLSQQGRAVAVLGIRELDEQQQTEILNALQKAKNDLENKVKESTEELRYANERLQIELSERKQAEAEIITRNRELTTLQAAGLAITSSLDLRHVLDTVTQEMVKLLGVERCTIFEWCQNDQTICMMAKYDVQGWWDSTSMAVVYRLADYPVTRAVLEERIPEQMTVHQPNIDPAELALMQKTDTCNRLLLPMMFKGQVVGLVSLEDGRAERTFTTQEISLVQLLANQAASAIENARLYERLDEERALLAQRVADRTEELSRANAELARAARLKDEFLAGMSHELRTPLNAILGSAEILQKEVFGSLTEKQLKYSKNIEESGQHLLSLINDILDLSKIEAGKMVMDIGPVSVKTVCESSLRLVKELAYKKRLQVTKEVDEAVTMVLADERRLKQILVNLLSNAVKFTPEGGQIGLKVTGDTAQQAVRFTIWDTGIGIAEEDMERLFKPFIQLDSSFSRQYAGTGLGLSLVSRMTELHGGGISVESRPGQGSRFTISLPWSPPTQANGPIETVQAQTGLPPRAVGPEQPRILLADDNEDNITLFQDYLQVQGFQVIVARNGAEAIARAQEERPDLVLMDIQMPGMDGLTATRRLRADATLAHMPIITLTALAMPGDRERCLAAGANGYLSKPVNLENLVQTIHTHLSQPPVN